MNLPTPAKHDQCERAPTSRPAAWSAAWWMPPVRLFASFVAGTTIVLLFEGLEQAVFPPITIWESHLLTALTVGIVGALAATANGRRHSRLLSQARGDATRCARAE